MFIRYETPKEFIKRFPVTSTIIAINVVLFLFMTFSGGSTNIYTLIRFGAFHPELINQGDWWRFITPTFLHIGFFHLFSNTISLLLFCSVFERLLGAKKYIFFYILTGIGATLLSYFTSNAVSAGASGAIFGVMGGFLYLYLTNHYSLDYSARQIIAPLIVLNLIFTFVTPKISVSGHIGGLITGFLLASLLFNQKNRR